MLAEVKLKEIGARLDQIPSNFRKRPAYHKRVCVIILKCNTAAAFCFSKRQMS
jgi:hypothetical protein